MELVQKENNCLQMFIHFFLALKLQVVSALQIIFSVSDGL